MIVAFSLLLSLIIFLFIFYYYARDDFFFIRKGISMEQLFNVLLLGLIGSIAIARLAFLILHTNARQPDQIALFSYSPGVSLFGGIVGLFVIYGFLTKRRKISRLRFFDYVSVALLAACPVLFLGVFLNIYFFIMYILLLLFFIRGIVPKYNKGTLKEGSLSLIFLIMASLVSFLQDIFLLYTRNILLTKESFLFFGLFLLSSLMLIRLETKKPVKSS